MPVTKPTSVSFATERALDPEEMAVIRKAIAALTTGGTVFVVDKEITDWTRDDIRQCVENIVQGSTFFYAGDDDLGDEVRRFLVDHPMTSNLEQVADDA